MAEKNAYRLYWRTGETNVVHGDTPAEAMTLAGYGSGSVRALDFYANGDALEYDWDADAREWFRKTPVLA